MTLPLVTVVIETINVRHGAGGGLADRLAGPLRGVAQQSWPQDRLETIVVVDNAVSHADCAEIVRRHPQVRLARSAASNYFAAKNAGAAAASGAFVILLDGDCVPEPDCIERLVERFDEGTAIVAGTVRYSGGSRAARIFSAPDFAYILTERDGQASGINLSNAAFRREVLERFPLDDRIARNGGCYQLYHRVRAAGGRVLLEPRAVAGHGLDVAGLGFLRKHFDRGYDGLTVYRLDTGGLFRGTAWVRTLGPFALAALTGRRILVDWVRIARHRRQMGISAHALPGYFLLGAGLRLVELAGGVTAFFRSAAPKGATAPAAPAGTAP